MTLRQSCSAIAFAFVVAVVGGCAQIEQNTPTASPSSSARQFYGDEAKYGAGAPSWLTDADYEQKVQSLDEGAKEKGITESPPAIVRWISYKEIFEVQGACLREEGVPVSPDPITGYWNDDPNTDDNLKSRAFWVCEWKYPIMPDKEHGKFSEKTKRVLYEYLAKDLVACLAAQGYKNENVPSYETFWDNYNTEKMWLPYENGKVFAWAQGKGIDIEHICPQDPPDGRLDYLYEED